MFDQADVGASWVLAGLRPPFDHKHPAGSECRERSCVVPNHLADSKTDIEGCLSSLAWPWFPRRKAQPMHPWYAVQTRSYIDSQKSKFWQLKVQKRLSRLSVDAFPEERFFVVP
ncbi:uncharacterized protein VDAG_05734 [Verticillium dahliae VdLs.17]|uniref:Uncharacterized protein n=1 Tax=Verticillium dahliae (strain VdLs.17 / ATCC MYA-4575 / FGSC 10137) TaxID=498257 RepID=G2X6F2_VERDV|nr:uncharacterized protein VDAG_05734 [Verticillium dahliae VdLs.17]EGY14570.1 hypothetical protein VDAG_05734 [Verticillium dahliae VdLs.17]KAH6708384.1 hypothetical protein EV126DRAFT_110095 [Verticillium dahliae]